MRKHKRIANQANEFPSSIKRRYLLEHFNLSAQGRREKAPITSSQGRKPRESTNSPADESRAEKIHLKSTQHRLGSQTPSEELLLRLRLLWAFFFSLGPFVCVRLSVCLSFLHVSLVESVSYCCYFLFHSLKYVCLYLSFYFLFFFPY